MIPTKPSTQFDGLRRHAESLVGNKAGAEMETFSTEQMQRLLHELKVHQAELELQNEELRRTQHQLEISQTRYFDLYNLAPVGYLTVDDQWLIREANQTVAGLLGVERDLLLRQPLTRFVFSDDQDILYLQRKQLAETNLPQSWDTRMLRADGSDFRAQLQVAPFQNGEIRIVLNDISELWQARQEMLKAQKIESLGVLAGGIAHDFNNILAAILGNVSLARIQVHDPEKVSKRLEEAEKATCRARDLARQLLTFARGGDPHKKVINVRNILKEAAGFALTGTNVKCLLSLANDLWTVEADEGQIVQVVHNLVLNAVHAMPEGGTVSVSAENVRARRNNRKYVKFSIADTGSGISEQNLAKIFDPYFTTKQSGSGLGLATSYSIIKKHGGKIRVTSAVEKGSTFTISLPASAQDCPAAEADTPKTVPHGSGRVLVMDDEEMLRELARAVLEELGYSVECAKNDAEAVDLYLKARQKGNPFLAVILDLTIPGGVGGAVTVKKLLEIDPNVKAIACSGYSDDPVMAKYRQCGFSGVLCKPFRLNELNNVIRGLMK